VFIGTGSAMAYEAFNTCIGFMDKNNECFLIDAGGVAKEISAKSLVLIHKADEFINSSAFFNDARFEFNGNIIVPEDGEVLKL